MLEWLNTSIVYWHWLVFGLLLATLEIMLFSFFLLWFGLSAIIIGLLLWFVPMTFSIQVMSWISLSILIIYSWFKHLSPYLKNKSLEEIPEEVILGQVGLVIEAHLGHKGKGVLRFSVPILGTDEWSFSCDEEIEVGQRVIVEKITQNNLLVSIK